MIITDKNLYFQILEKFKIVPYTQSRGWYDVHSLYKPERIIFFVNDNENPTIACYAHKKIFLGVKMILIEGEAYKDSKSSNLKDIRNFYKNISELGYQIIEVASNATYDFDYETALRQAGYLRPIGQFCLPSTKIIDLQQPIQYNQNWKRNLKKNQSFNLKFDVISKTTLEDCEDFLDIYRMMTNRKNLTFNFSPQQVFNLCSSDNFQLFFVSENGERQAAIIIHKANNKAGLLYAATTKNALNTFASFFMYDQLFKYLSESGFLFFDMEKLLPSTDAVNNVFLFKNGIQGTHLQLNGEWSWYKNAIYRSSMYFVKKYLMKKREL